MDNEFFVGMNDDHAIIMRPVQRLNKIEAINLIAWLIVLLDIEDSELIEAINAVKAT